MVVPAERRSIGPALSYLPLGALLLFASTGAAGPERSSRGAIAANAVALLVALIVSTIAHEAGHAFAARAVGFDVARAYLGRGPAVWHREVRGVELVLQALPLTGAVIALPSSMRGLRARLMVFYAGGPAANALLLAACLALLGPDDGFDAFAHRPVPVLAMLAANATLVVANLLPTPQRKKRGVQTRGTDGWMLITAPFRPDAALVSLLTAHAAWAAPRLLARSKATEARALVDEALRREPSSVLARIALTDWLVATRRWSEAAAHLRALLGDETTRRTHAGAFPILANNLAWAGFMLDDASLLEEADRCSQEALAAAPDNVAIHGTRGAILLARGELDAALERLTFAFARNTPPNKALNACCIAMLHARRGQRTEAASWLARARALSPNCSLLRRAEAVVVEGSR